MYVRKRARGPTLCSSFCPSMESVGGAIGGKQAASKQDRRRGERLWKLTLRSSVDFALLQRAKRASERTSERACARERAQEREVNEYAFLSPNASSFLHSFCWCTFIRSQKKEKKKKKLCSRRAAREDMQNSHTRENRSERVRVSAPLYTRTYALTRIV